MRFHVVRMFVVAAAFVVAMLGGAPASATVNADVGGDWMFRFAGNRGGMVLHFPGTPQFGTFQVHGAGYSTLFPEAPFTVHESEVQTLSYDSRRRLSGTILLDNPTHVTTVGQIVVTRGTVNSTSTSITLVGTLVIGEATPKKVTMVGTRYASPETSPTGRTFDGRLAGRRVISTKYEVRVYDETSSADGLVPVVHEGFPFLVLKAGGPANVNGVEFPGSRIEGLLFVDSHGQVFGRVACTEFGLGNVRGVLTTDPVLLVPVVSLAITCDDGRRLRMSAKLSSF